MTLEENSPIALFGGVGARYPAWTAERLSVRCSRRGAKVPERALELLRDHREALAAERHRGMGEARPV